MIQNMLIFKKGIPGLIYAQAKFETEDAGESTVIVTEVNE